MIVNITVRKEPTEGNVWKFSGSLNFNVTTEIHSVKVQLENGIILFEGNPAEAMKWLSGFIRGIL